MHCKFKTQSSHVVFVHIVGTAAKKISRVCVVSGIRFYSLTQFDEKDVSCKDSAIFVVCEKISVMLTL